MDRPEDFPPGDFRGETRGGKKNMKRTSILIVGLIVLLAAGCVTNKKFETTVSDMTSRVDGISGSVEEHGKRLDQLDQKDQQLAQDIRKVDGAVVDARQKGEQAIVKADEAAKAARGKVIWSVTLTNRDLRFGSDQAALTPAGMQVLDALVEKIKGFDRMVFVEIQGHTDSSGAEIYNQVLGEKRAEVVRDYFHEKGIPLNLMQVISYGETRPIADNKTAEGRAQNRRVEVLILE